MWIISLRTSGANDIPTVLHYSTKRQAVSRYCRFTKDNSLDVGIMQDVNGNIVDYTDRVENFVK